MRTLFIEGGIPMWFLLALSLIALATMSERRAISNCRARSPTRAIVAIRQASSAGVTARNGSAISSSLATIVNTTSAARCKLEQMRHHGAPVGLAAISIASQPAEFLGKLAAVGNRPRLDNGIEDRYIQAAFRGVFGFSQHAGIHDRCH